ncbi:hypothetical protein ES703_03727 [subsurface metagenome]
MSNIQLEAFGELFQSPQAIERYRNEDYGCPFDNRIGNCDKPNKDPSKYGNCSVQIGESKRIICPRRFYANNYAILADVKSFIWPNELPISCYCELQIRSKTVDGDSFHFGNLDWILVNQENTSDFCGVEIQTDSTTNTGQFRIGIQDLLSNNLSDRYTFGLNTLASFKGFLPQFIFKGQLFDDWKKPYCAIMQDELWEKFIRKFRIRRKEITEYTTETFLFFIYSLVLDEESNRYTIRNRRVYGSRWIDLLFSFSVEGDLLISLDEMVERIQRKANKGDPLLVI